MDKSVYLKKLFKLTSDHFLFGHVVLVLIVKKLIGNSILHQIYAGYEKKSWKKLFVRKISTNLLQTIFFIWGIFFLISFVKNVFIKIKNSISSSKYTRYGKNG